MVSAEEPAAGVAPQAPEDAEDADIELARLIQEQERALFFLQGGRLQQNGAGGDVTPEEQEAAEGDDDEAFARALQEQEAREFQARLLAMAGFAPGEVPEAAGEDDDEDAELEGGVDVDAMSYEELLALGDAAGHVSRSASTEAIDALPESIFDDAKQAKCGEAEQCAVCRMEFSLGDVLSTLPCCHFYHKDCVLPWLRVNKVCPVCKYEVTPARKGPRRPAIAETAATIVAAAPAAAPAMATPLPPAPTPATSTENSAGGGAGDEPARRGILSAQALLRQPLQEAQSSSSPATPVDQQGSGLGSSAQAPSKRDEPAVVSGAASGLSTPVSLRFDVTPPPPALATVPPPAPVPTRMRLPR